MDLLIVLGTVVGLILLYFFLGIAIKLLWGWWILIIAVPTCVFVGVYLGWVGAFCSVIGFFVALAANNGWHDTKLYLSVESLLDKAFYFKDT